MAKKTKENWMWLLVDEDSNNYWIDSDRASTAEEAVNLAVSPKEGWGPSGVVTVHRALAVGDCAVQTQLVAVPKAGA